MNKQKSEGTYLGKKKPPNLNNEINWTENPVKCLGIYFGKDKQLIEKINWESKLVKLTRKLNSWKARKLTYYGKIVIVKTLGISQILYNANCLHVPNHIVKKVNKQLFTFVWNSGTEKVKRKTTTGNLEQGGLQMVDLEHQIAALKIKWISRLYKENNDTTWKKIFKSWFEPYGGLSFLLVLIEL